MKRLIGLVVLLATPAYAEREVFAPSQLAPTANAGTVLFGDGSAAAPSMSFSANTNTGIYRNSFNVLGVSANGNTSLLVKSNGITLGNETTSPAPVSKTIAATNASGTDVAGATLTFDGGNSTGTAAGGSLIFRTAPAGGVSGTTANTLTERMRIDSAGDVFIGNGATNASPTEGAVRATGGSGTNIAGANLLLTGGQGTGTGAGGVIRFSTALAGSSGSTPNSLTERMRINSLGHLYIGNGETSGTPVSGEIRATNGSGTNIAGANLSLYGGVSTGSANSGIISFFTNLPGASGTGLNPTVERMRIDSAGSVIIGNGDSAATPVTGVLRGTNASGTNIAGAALTIRDGRGTGTGVGGGIEFFTTSSGVSGSSLNTQLIRWRISETGSLIADSSNGGDIVLTRGATSVRQPVGTGIAAAGTNSATATVLTKSINAVSTVNAGEGVRLTDSGTGSQVWVQNNGANDLELYPTTGGAINGAATDAGITLTAANDQIAVCSRYATNNWMCTVSNGPNT